MSLEIVPVQTKPQWRDFHHVPYTAYAGDPHWVAPPLLERKFQALLGHSPHRQIVHTKIERVKHLLVESEISIAVVAELAGFDSASYLSVAFRRETGESPYAFRARQRTSKAAS